MLSPFHESFDDRFSLMRLAYGKIDRARIA